jgi:hypothetical protein
MAEIVKFAARDDDKEAVIELLETALEKARAGEMNDVLIVAAIKDENGPQFWHGYYGQAAYATLLAGLSAAEFDLHYRRYNPDED